MSHFQHIDLSGPFATCIIHRIEHLVSQGCVICVIQSNTTQEESTMKITINIKSDAQLSFFLAAAHDYLPILEVNDPEDVGTPAEMEELEVEHHLTTELIKELNKAVMEPLVLEPILADQLATVLSYLMQYTEYRMNNIPEEVTLWEKAREEQARELFLHVMEEITRAEMKVTCPTCGTLIPRSWVEEFGGCGPCFRAGRTAEQEDNNYGHSKHCPIVPACVCGADDDDYEDEETTRLIEDHEWWGKGL